MSFELVCDRCGAPSGPSVGMCPFCKAVMTVPPKDKNPTLTKIRKLYSEGKLEQALSLAKLLDEENGKQKKNVSFLLTYAKILIEVEGPGGRIKSLLMSASLIEPDNIEISDYFDIVEARYLMTHEGFAQGELLLRSLLRRSPNNVHALFLLGSQLYHLKNDATESIRYLERCIGLRPPFLRAWGCLGAIYDRSGQTTLAERAFRKCLSLETNPRMRAFFERQISQKKLLKAS